MSFWEIQCIGQHYIHMKILSKRPGFPEIDWDQTFSQKGQSKSQNYPWRPKNGFIVKPFPAWKLMISELAEPMVSLFPRAITYRTPLAYKGVSRLQHEPWKAWNFMESRAQLKNQSRHCVRGATIWRDSQCDNPCCIEELHLRFVSESDT